MTTATKERSRTSLVAPLSCSRAIQRTTRKPRLGITAREIKILIRTRMAMEFGRRIFSFGELVEFTSGRKTDWVTWQRLKRQGYVANTRSGIGVKLTSKGFEKLKALGR